MSEADNNPAVTKTAEQTAAEAAAAAAKTLAVITAIKAKFNNSVDVIDAKFAFRKVENKVEEEVNGEKVVKTIVTKRPTVELKIPRPSFEGIIDILQKGVEPDATITQKKQLDLLFEAIQDVVLNRAREIVNETEDINQDNFPIDQLSWEAIANLPKAERRGGGIAAETWKDFVADYIEVMPKVTGKTKERIEAATKLFLNKFSTIKTDKPVLQLLKGQLALYLNNTGKGEEFEQCVEFLVDKATTLIEADSTKLLDNL